MIDSLKKKKLFPSAAEMVKLVRCFLLKRETPMSILRAYIRGESYRERRVLGTLCPVSPVFGGAEFLLS